MELPNPHRVRRAAGLALYLLAMAVGLVLLLVLFLLPPLSSGDTETLRAMAVGAALAFPAATMYLTVPRLLDRYDPEPWYALIGCLLWGAIAACGFSAVTNTMVASVGTEIAGPTFGAFLGSVISAPIVEEFWKGLGVLGMFYFLRREFDGVVDGIIYASFTGLGFAAVENVIYYSEAVQSDSSVLALTVVIRGVLAPWGHPLYTSMTGIGFGIARETTRRSVRWGAPILGYGGAVLLHMLWNGSGMIVEAFGDESGLLFFVIVIPIWITFVVVFLLIVIMLVRRRGQIIRKFLRDEVMLGNISQQELDIVASAFGVMLARARWGAVGVRFARAVARLSLSKWHAARALEARTSTISEDFIAPLRKQIAHLRNSLPA